MGSGPENQIKTTAKPAANNVASITDNLRTIQETKSEKYEN